MKLELFIRQEQGAIRESVDIEKQEELMGRVNTLTKMFFWDI